MKVADKISIGKIDLKSRIVLPPMATQSADNGIINEKLIDYYKNFAKNKIIGLIITEHSYVAIQGKADPHQMSFASDDVIPYQKKLTDTLHAENSELKVFAQINHAGLKTSKQITGHTIVSASDVRIGDTESRALTVAEINFLSDTFADAALRVKNAGYDGVELHSAHGYLFNQFYSPLTNFRTDEYGAENMENRLRFLLETIEKVKKAVGDDYPIAVRLGGSDFTDGGSTVEEAVEASTLLEKAGINFIDISGGFNGYIRKGCNEAGWFSDMSEAVKKKVNIPVMLTGGIRTMEQVENLLKENKADLIGVGRAMMKNPMWGF